jgi:hypothetical protein
VPKKGLRAEVLLVFPVSMVKRIPLKQKRKEYVILRNLNFPVNIGKSEHSSALENGRKWQEKSAVGALLRLAPRRTRLLCRTPSMAQPGFAESACAEVL